MLNQWRTAFRRIPPLCQNRPSLQGKRVALWVCHTVNLACAVHLFAQHVGWFHRMAGPSMIPTFAESGEWVIESRVIDPRKLSRGDLVVYFSPLDPTRLVCKRVIGLPGDTICVDPTGTMAPSTEHVIVPKGHLWMIGDNVEFSRDSRTYGPVSMALVKGRLVARFWPLCNFIIFRSNFEYMD